VSPSALLSSSTASWLSSEMASTECPAFTTATEVLQAILDGGAALNALEAHLTRHDVTDARFALEAWKGVCGGTEAEAEERAFDARMAVVVQYVDLPPIDGLPLWSKRTLVELLVGSSQRTSYAAFGDEYIAGVLKLQLPVAATVCVPRATPAYTKAAIEFDDKVNDVVRPLLKTSLKKLLIDAKWNDPDRGALIAAVVTLREIVRAPELYIDSDAAAADPAVPCIFIRREVVGSYPGGFGVLHHGQFAVARTPLEAIAHWMLCSQDDNPAVAAMVAALDGRDTRSSIAKSILSGRKVLNAPPDVPP